MLRDQAMIALDELEAERDGALEAKDRAFRALDDLSIERCSNWAASTHAADCADCAVSAAAICAVSASGLANYLAV